MSIYHKHHIIPRHMGGTDNPENLVIVTIEQHSLLHKQLWEDLGHEEDRIAWLCLSGQITKSEARILAVKAALTGKKQSKRHLQRRSNKGKKYKPCSNERKMKLSKAMKGKKLTETTKKAIREAHAGSCWINNGTQNKKLKKGECLPHGWKKGRIMIFS